MKNPLTREQESLRGRRVEDLTDAQLKLWVDTCERMVRWVKPAKARRTWTSSQVRAEAEIAKRAQRAGRLRDHAG